MRNPYLPGKDVVDGKVFERHVLGKNELGEVEIEDGVNFEQAIEEVIQKRWDGKRVCPESIIGDVLHYHVSKYLKFSGLKIKTILFLETSGAWLDALFQSDAVFLAKTEDGYNLVATIDVALFGGMIDKKYILMGDDEYLATQFEFYANKRKNKKNQRSIGLKNWPVKRSSNHFILTMNDLFRRGLKRLGRLIARSMVEQYKEKTKPGAK